MKCKKITTIPKLDDEYNFKESQICTDRVAISVARERFDYMCKSLDDPKLVTLNNSKLAVLSKDGLHDLLSTSTLTLYILTKYFGDFTKWSIPVRHSYEIYELPLEEEGELAVNLIIPKSDVFEENTLSGFHSIDYSKLETNSKRDPAADCKLKIKELRFVVDYHIPEFSKIKECKAMKLLMAGSRVFDANNGNFVLLVYVKWTEIDEEEEYEGVMDIKYVIACPKFHTSLILLFPKEVSLINLIKFVDYTETTFFEEIDGIEKYDTNLTTYIEKTKIAANNTQHRKHEYNYIENYKVTNSQTFEKNKINILYLKSSNIVDKKVLAFARPLDMVYLACSHALCEYVLTANTLEDDVEEKNYPPNPSTKPSKTQLGVTEQVWVTEFIQFSETQNPKNQIIEDTINFNLLEKAFGHPDIPF